MVTNRNKHRRTFTKKRFAKWVAGIAAAVLTTVLTGIVAGWVNRIPGINPDTPPTVASSSSAAEPGEPFTLPGLSPGGVIEPPPPQGQPPTGDLRLPAAFAGTWSGHIKPTPALMSEHDIRIVLTKGQPTASWEEPTSGCTGTLLLTSVERDMTTFILQVGAACVPGTVTLTRKGDALAYRWVESVGIITYTGDLQRS